MISDGNFELIAENFQLIIKRLDILAAKLEQIDSKCLCYHRTEQSAAWKDPSIQ